LSAYLYLYLFVTGASIMKNQIHCIVLLEQQNDSR